MNIETMLNYFLVIQPWNRNKTGKLTQFETDATPKKRREMEIKTPDIHKINPSFGYVAHVISDVINHKESYDYGNFCILAFIADPQDYIQTIGGTDEGEMRLEHRKYKPDGSYEHYYMTALLDSMWTDCIHEKYVEPCFRSFYYSTGWPSLVVFNHFDI